jgi:hypothetical protein
MVSIEDFIPLFAAGALYFFTLIAFNLRKSKAQ